MIEYIAMGANLLFLACVGWKDYKTQEVSNRVLLVYGLTAFVVSLIQLALLRGSFLYVAIVGIEIFLSFGFFHFGMGGADTKALMCVALMQPLLYPLILVISLTMIVIVAVWLRGKDRQRDVWKIDYPFITFMFFSAIIANLLL